MAGVVYEIVNNINGKKYIGLTRVGIDRRWKEHVRSSKRRPKTILQFAIAKYGESSFTIREVASAISLDLLPLLEKDLIAQEKPEYNQTCGGEFTAGRKYSDAVKEVIRLKNTGQKRNQETCRNISEAKRKQYAERPELRQKSSEWLRENRALWEDKRIEAVRKSATGRKMSPEHKEKIRQISKTRHRSKEEIQKMALAKTKKVICLNDGKVYSSRREAALAVGVSEKAIWRACNGQRKLANGLAFSYLMVSK